MPRFGRGALDGVGELSDFTSLVDVNCALPLEVSGLETPSNQWRRNGIDVEADHIFRAPRFRPIASKRSSPQSGPAAGRKNHVGWSNDAQTLPAAPSQVASRVLQLSRADRALLAVARLVVRDEDRGRSRGSLGLGAVLGAARHNPAQAGER